MRTKEITGTAGFVPRTSPLPKHVTDSIEAGLDDLRCSRGVSGDQVLVKLDQLAAEMIGESRKRPLGEDRADRREADH